MQLDDFLNSFVDKTQDSIAVIHSPGPDQEGRIVWCNAAFEKQHRIAADQVIGHPIGICFDPTSYREMLDQVRPHMKEGATGANAEVLCRRADGTTYWGSLQILYAPRDATGARYSAGIIRDISDTKAREAAAASVLEQSEAMAQRFEALWARMILAIDTLEGPMGIWDKDMRLVICNKAFGPRLLGREVPNEPNMSVEEFIHDAAYSGKFIEAIGNEEEWIENARAGVMTRQMNDMTKYTDGRTFLAQSQLSENGDMVVHNMDMTDALARQEELHQKNKQLEKARTEALLRANRDELTDVGNRRSLTSTLAQFSAARHAHGGEIAALQIDLDRFKPINDTLGHAAGDHVLRVVATRLQALVEDNDHLARIGGDEFVILRHSDTARETVHALGGQIVDAIARPIRYHDSDLRVGGSVGVALTPLSGSGDLLVHADVALYRAKSKGRGQVQVFDEPDMIQMRRAKAEGDAVLAALEQNQFIPWYQPQIDAVTGHIVGLEALARWDHPQKGILAPAAFIQQADDLNILGELDRIIFETAIEACTDAFADLIPLDLSFNASEERLMSSDMDNLITRALQYPGKVSIELIENILMDDRTDTFRFQLDRLREAGIGIELDDFGSGRASIVALEQIAPDRLKIDRRLVAPVATSDRSARLLRSIVDIGDALEIRVTAEGVETAEQAEVLRDLGCERFQGYYFGRPMSLDDILARYDIPKRPRDMSNRRA